MKETAQSVKKRLLLAAALLAFSTVVLAERVYVHDGGNHKWVYAGQTPGDSNKVTACNTVKKECWRLLCSSCHSQLPPDQKYSVAEARKHFSQYFPKIELRLAEGQEIDFGKKLMLLRERNRLISVDSKGNKFQFPGDARILKDESGEPIAVVYSGSEPPQRLAGK